MACRVETISLVDYVRNLVAIYPIGVKTLYLKPRNVNLMVAQEEKKFEYITCEPRTIIYPILVKIFQSRGRHFHPQRPKTCSCLL